MQKTLKDKKPEEAQTPQPDPEEQPALPKEDQKPKEAQDPEEILNSTFDTFDTLEKFSQRDASARILESIDSFKEEKGVASISDLSPLEQSAITFFTTWNDSRSGLNEVKDKLKKKTSQDKDYLEQFLSQAEKDLLNITNSFNNMNNKAVKAVYDATVQYLKELIELYKSKIGDLAKNVQIPKEQPALPKEDKKPKEAQAPQQNPEEVQDPETVLGLRFDELRTWPINEAMKKIRDATDMARQLNKNRVLVDWASAMFENWLLSQRPTDIQEQDELLKREQSISTLKNVLDFKKVTLVNIEKFYSKMNNQTAFHDVIRFINATIPKIEARINFLQSHAVVQGLELATLLV